MTRRFVLLAASLVALSAATAGAQKAQYRARLSPVPLDVAMQATIAGSGSVTATLNGTTLTLTGNYAGLKTASTVARVHRSPRTAMRGPAIGDLTIAPGTSGSIAGTLELTKEQVEDLANGRLYIQLHSEKAPEGNLWGWLFIQEGRK
ncbi:MAG: CHRD domain-containing protein [Acidobacteriota bacterium]|nr:CHRD domain-containing protein [Acidobacteriota bacterium]